MCKKSKPRRPCRRPPSREERILTGNDGPGPRCGAAAHRAAPPPGSAHFLSWFRSGRWWCPKPQWLPCHRERRLHLGLEGREQLGAGTRSSGAPEIALPLGRPESPKRRRASPSLPTGNQRPVSRRWVLSILRVTPGSTTTEKSPVFSSRIRSM